MQFMDDSHFDELFNEDVFIEKPDGSPLLVLVKGGVSEENYLKAYIALKKFRVRTENRSTASGITAVPRVKMDGTLSGTSRVPKGWGVISGILGYFERQVRFPYCHACAWNAKHPALFATLYPMLQQCTGHFGRLIPERFANQKAMIDRTNKDFIIPGTVYTTVTVNKNFRTAAHKDAGDLESGFSNMIVFAEGIYQGGELVLPDWRLAVKLDHRDLVMFDAHEFHGNTQIIPITKAATRTSIVCYYREKMHHCKSQKEELAFAKNRKIGDPIFPGEE